MMSRPARTNSIYSDPVAYFLTWPTYGTWLPGDGRGWVEYREGWKLPNPILEREAAARMTEGACVLPAELREAVEDQLAETCRHRGWRLHAAVCRSNHVHAVVSADAPPKKVRADLKAWATRRLKRSAPDRVNWWAERGSVRYVWGEDSLATVVAYVAEAQDRKGRES